MAPKEYPDCSLSELSCSEEVLLSISEYVQHGREDLFIVKLKQCSGLLEFGSKTDSDLQKKEMKCECLKDMIKFLKDCREAVTPKIYPHVIDMFARNVFRTFSSSNNQARIVPSEVDKEEEEDACMKKTEETYPHIELVYKLFIKFLKSDEFQVEIAKEYINPKFIRSLLNSFKSEDLIERVALSNVLHRIYVKMTSLRDYITKEVSNTLCLLIEERTSHIGVAEILDFMASVISGYAQPLKKEYKMFLLKVLMPLHKLWNLAQFSRELTFCLQLFLSKDFRLFEPVVKYLINNWPKFNTAKQLLFLGELEELLEYISPMEFEKIMIPLFKQLVDCVNSPHVKVSVRAILICSTPYILSLIEENADKLLPVILLSLNKSSCWKMSVRKLITELMGMMESIAKKAEYKQIMCDIGEY